MRYIILLSLVFLSGCNTFHDTFWEHKDKIIYVDKPIWTPPAIKMPPRPILKSINNSKIIGSASEVLDTKTKNIQTDLSEVTTYAEKLEGIVESVKDYKP